MSETFAFPATAAHRGVRVDQFLVEQRSDWSRSRVQALMVEGRVTISGQVFKASYRMKGNEVVVVVLPAPTVTKLVAENLPLHIVYQDTDIAVIDKAAGMVVHPGAGHSQGTLVNALLHHVGDLQGVGGELRPGIVHRLDKDTSGLLVIAKHETALRALQAAFKSRDVEKTYLALVSGHPVAQGTFETLHARHPKHRQRFTGRLKTGKKAVTHYVVRRQFASAALVEVSLMTGRTHQIRMHFAEAGFPLLADELYGNRQSQRPAIISRQALHAWRLSFAHPRSGKRLTFTAPIPDDFAQAQRLL